MTGTQDKGYFVFCLVNSVDQGLSRFSNYADKNKLFLQKLYSWIFGGILSES